MALGYHETITKRSKAKSKQVSSNLNFLGNLGKNTSVFVKAFFLNA